VKPAAAELMESLAFARFHYRGRPVLEPQRNILTRRLRGPTSTFDAATGWW
jgi:hypothetical protein